MARFRVPSILNPQGPLPGSTYWWRRISIGLVILAVIVLAVALSRLGNHSPSGRSAGVVTTSSSSASSGPASTPSVTASPSATPTPTPTATTPAPCTSGSLTVVVVTSAKTYPAGTSVAFTTTVSTTGPACVITGGLQIVVTSGDDRIWGSADCSSAATGTDSLPTAGSASVQRTWDRLRTKEACAPVNGSKATTAGTYRAVATWGGVTSAPAVFSLT